MEQAVLLGPWAIALFVIFKDSNYILSKYNGATESQKLGCGPAPVYTTGHLLGTYSYFETINAARGDGLLEYMWYWHSISNTAALVGV
ncbi:hypothetical protein BBP40_005300 [Aspergillus hancockii]|nr:hypothetical protein BBP40_005300 [Aspergillus hancockii]